MIKFKKDELAEKITRASKIATNVGLTKENNNIYLHANNGVIYLKTLLSQSDDDIKATTCLNCWGLMEILKTLKPGECSLSFNEESKIIFTCGKHISKFPIMFTEYPKIANEEKLFTIQFLNKTLRSMIDNTSASMSQDFKLNGYNFIISEDGLRVLATNGFSLSYNFSACSNQVGLTALLPFMIKDVIEGIPDDKMIDIDFGKTKLTIKYDDYEIVIRYMSAQFPDCSGTILSENKITFTLKQSDAERLVSAGKAASGNSFTSLNVSGKKDTEVKFDISEDGIEFDEIVDSLPNRDFNFSVNPRYMLEILSKFGKDENVNFYIDEANKIFMFNDLSKQYLLMPVRKTDEKAK